MSVCANPKRMYMGTARQYMDKQCNCQPCHMDHQQHRNVRTIEPCACEKNNEKKAAYASNCQLICREDACQPESMCVDLPLAMVYMNPQPYTGLISCELALERGSAFNNLYEPWKIEKYR